MKNALLTALLALVALATTHAQPRSVPAFRAISVGSGIEVMLEAGHPQRVLVDVQPAELSANLKTTVESGTLVIRYDPPDRRQEPNSQLKLRVAITADQLTALAVGSGSSVRAGGNFAAESFKLDVSSGGSLTATMSTGSLSVDQRSGSTVSLRGQATSLTLATGSGATFNGDKLQTSSCRVQASSGSSVQVAVKDDLVAEASSGASVRYSGSPQVTKRVSSGGSVSGQ